MSGLAAGIRMAHFDEKALILERHHRVGGLNSFYTLGGYNFDVGLHAMTNYMADPPRSAPISKLSRQLRIKFPEFKLAPQKSSKIVFPGVELEFSNDYDKFTEEVRSKFPGKIDNFIRFTKAVREYNIFDFDAPRVSARKVVGEIIKEPLLLEMIMAPILFYGSPQENDIEFSLFVTLYRSVLMEGLSRPPDIRHVLNLLTDKYKEEGGELRLSAGVKRILTLKGKVTGVELDSGEIVEGKSVISSAGFPETCQLCPEAAPPGGAPKAGELSLMESIHVIKKPACELGTDITSIFYNKGERVNYRKPEEPVDLGSGVICYCDNYEYDEPKETNIVRLTHLANSDFWINADEETYQSEKKKWLQRSMKLAGEYGPDLIANTKFSDVFTPRTIKKFTGHINGAMYGCPEKLRTAKMEVDGLYLCGTDQGFCGIVGAMLSGIVVANMALRSD